MIKLLCKILLAIALLLPLLPSDVLAQRDCVFVGPRAVAMGSAYLATANDAEAVYWNPAALAKMEHIHINFSFADFGHADFGRINFQNYYAYASLVAKPRFIPKLAKYLTFGVDWLRTKFIFKTANDQAHFALGLRPLRFVYALQNLTFGASAKLWDGSRWNLGMLYSLPLPCTYKLGFRLDLGLMLYDKYGTPNDQFISSKSTFKGHKMRYGLSWQRQLTDPLGLLVAVDYGERLHFGTEFDYDLFSSLKLFARMGIQKDIYSGEEITKSFGFAVQWTPSKVIPKFLIARTGSPEWNSSYQFGVAAVLESTEVPTPNCDEPPEVCPSKTILHWQGSEEDYEHGYIIQRRTPKTDYKFVDGVSWREDSYAVKNLLPDSSYYRIFAYIDNNDPPLLISEACHVDTPPPDIAWSCDLNISYSGSSPITLTFGQAATATDSIDTTFCEKKLSPATTDSIFDARFYLPIDSIQSLVDFRADMLDTLEWAIRLQPIGQVSIVLTWDNKSFAEDDSVMLRDVQNDRPIDMTSVTTYSIFDGNGNNNVAELRIKYFKKTLRR